jgi:hypothetical protein
MSHYRPVMRADQAAEEAAAQVVACPACDARLSLARSRIPSIDACGFESYSLECKRCGAALAGVIDPFDERFLFSEIVPLAQTTATTAPQATKSGR